MDQKQKQLAVVIGVGPGLGAALARRFATGYRVALVARGSEKLEELGGEINKSGGEAFAVSADVSKPAEIDSAFARIRAQAG